MRGAMDTIIIRRETDTSDPLSVDDEGFMVTTPEDVEVKGSFHIRKSGTDELTPDEIGKFGEIVRGTVRVPLTADVKHGDIIVLDSLKDKFGGIDKFVGTYEIENIQYTRTHLRIEIRKSRS